MHLLVNVDLTAFPLALIDNFIKRRLHKNNHLARMQLQIIIVLGLSSILVKEHIVVHYDVLVDCFEHAEGSCL